MKNQLKKVVLTGTVALSTLLFAGVTSAASYTVQPGDTLYLIGQKHGVGVTAMVNANPQLSNPNNIWPGLTINVPGGTQTQSQFAMEVYNLVNKERAKAGLKPLSFHQPLSVMALDKAKDMYYNGYFSHQSPYFGSPFDMMKKYGIRYSYAGENIAMGQRSPQEVMNAWMNSAGHRQNILNPNFKSIGIAYYKGEWVQEFIG